MNRVSVCGGTIRRFEVRTRGDWRATLYVASPDHQPRSELARDLWQMARPKLYQLRRDVR
jgi:hypothetical protein